MVALLCDLEVGDFVWMGGDLHIYDNHEDQVKTQLERIPFKLPTLVIKRKPELITGFTINDFELLDYLHHPTISAPVAV